LNFFKRPAPGEPELKIMEDGGRFYVELGGIRYQLSIRRNKRAKKLRLRIEMPGRIKLTLPARNSLKIAFEFIRSEAEWIKTQLDKVPTAIPFLPEQNILFRGKQYRLVHDNRPRGLVDIKGDQIIVPGGMEHFPRRLNDWLKKQAKVKITAVAEFQATALGESFSAIRIRDTKTRWGSCSARRSLNFSWRLIMAPDFVWQYVVIHEVCHLAELNHSPAFWALVKSRDPEYIDAQNWLKENGAGLHAYGS
jgi:predicted metal-dependent hydrolase